MDRLDLEHCLAEVRARPDDPLAWQAVGVAYVESACWNDAFAAFRRAVTLAPHNAAAVEGLLVAARQSGRVADIETLLMSSSTAPAHLGRGLAAFARGDMALAARSFEEAAALDPARAETWYNLAASHANLQQWDAAAVAFRRFLTVEPADVAGWRGLGRAEAGAHHYDEAAAAYQRAIDLGGDSAACHLQLGKALGDAGRWGEAAAALREAARLDPRNPAVFIALAFASGRMAADERTRAAGWSRERCQRAEVGALEAALRLQADNPTTWRSLARAREALGDHAGARDAAARASTLSRAAASASGDPH